MVPAGIARPWQDGVAGLYMAARIGHEAVVRLLIEHKAAVDAANKVPCQSAASHAARAACAPALSSPIPADPSPRLVNILTKTLFDHWSNS